MIDDVLYYFLNKTKKEPVSRKQRPVSDGYPQPSGRSYSSQLLGIYMGIQKNSVYLNSIFLFLYIANYNSVQKEIIQNNEHKHVGIQRKGKVIIKKKKNYNLHKNLVNKPLGILFISVLFSP